MTLHPDVTIAAHSLDPVSLLDRPAVAAAAGFGKLGLSLSQARYSFANGVTTYRLSTELARWQVGVGEVEGLVASTEAAPDDEDFAFELAASLGAEQLTVLAPREGRVGEVTGRLVHLNERARRHGIRVALEPLPWTMAADPVTATKIASEAGVGLCLDVWHVFRHGGSLADLAECWPAVTTIQLSDGHPRTGIDDPIRDCLDHRLLPGEGTFPLREVLARAPSARLSVEVLSRRLRALPAGQGAQRIGSAVHALLTGTTAPRSA